MGLLDAIFGDNSSDDAVRALERNKQLYGNIALPDYQEYAPELFTGESANYELIDEDPALKSAQMQALAKLSGLADTGHSAADEADFFRAREIGAQAAKSGTQAAIADANARGVGGGGMEFAMREIANQGGQQRAQEAGMQKAADAARQRALYNQAYAQNLSQVRGQDQNVNQANTGIINQFNQANTQQRNALNQANVEQRNAAFQYNQGLKDKRYDNQMRRADALAGVNNQQSQARLAESAADSERRRALLGAGASVLGGYLGSK